MNVHSRHCEKGSGILAALIFSAVLLILFQQLSDHFLNTGKFQKYEIVQISNRALKNYIENSVSCFNTTKELSNSCQVGSYIEVISRSEQTLISVPNGPNFEKIGDFQLRAVCKSCKKCPKGRAIGVESRLVDNDNKPVKNPLRKSNLWTSIYRKNKFLCEFE